MNILKNGAFALLAVGLMACDGATSDDTDSGTATGDRISDIAALTPDAANGAAFYDVNCAVCHGTAGTGQPPLDGEIDDLTLEDIIDNVIEGPGTMPSFSDRSDQDIADVSNYVFDTF